MIVAYQQAKNQVTLTGDTLSLILAQMPSRILRDQNFALSELRAAARQSDRDHARIRRTLEQRDVEKLIEAYREVRDLHRWVTATPISTLHAARLDICNYERCEPTLVSLHQEAGSVANCYYVSDALRIALPAERLI